MADIYSGLGTKDKEAVDKLAEQHKLDKNLLSIAVMSGQSDAVKVLTDSIKSTVAAAVKEAKASGGGEPTPTHDAQLKIAQERVALLDEQMKKAQEAGNVAMQVGLRRRLTIANNELRALQG